MLIMIVIERDIDALNYRFFDKVHIERIDRFDFRTYIHIYLDSARCRSTSDIA
jgi:hypothetical protein